MGWGKEEGGGLAAGGLTKGEEGAAGAGWGRGLIRIGLSGAYGKHPFPLHSCLPPQANNKRNRGKLEALPFGLQAAHPQGGQRNQAAFKRHHTIPHSLLAHGSPWSWSPSSLGKPPGTPVTTASCPLPSPQAVVPPPPPPATAALPIPKVRGLSATAPKPMRPWATLVSQAGPLSGSHRALRPPPLLSGGLPGGFQELAGEEAVPLKRPQAGRALRKAWSPSQERRSTGKCQASP